MSLNFVVLAALLASTGLSTPVKLHSVPNTTNATIHNRQASLGQGVDSGISISIFEKPGCKGNGLKNQEMIFTTNYAQQMRSYHLSDDIGSDDVLSFYADIDWTATGSKSVDPSLNNNPQACAQFAYFGEDKALKAGCHTLPNVLGCVGIWVNQTLN